MNSITLVGRLTKDPELTERGDTKVCDLRIAVNGRGDQSPLFIDVAAFGPQGEACNEYLSKGSQVSVAGSLRYSEWEKKPTGKGKAAKAEKRSKHSVVAQSVQFLDAKPDESNEASEQSS
jgi:single-strand DNA-binding protein